MSFALALSLLAGPAKAQQTIFNVPSADVLDRRVLYLESDWYVRPWRTRESRAVLTSARGVLGLGAGLEAGLNFGLFDLLHEDSAFIDAAAKWAVWKEGRFGAYLGSQAGAGFSGKARSLTYGAAYADVGRLRAGAGPYFATSRVFGDRSRGGLLATFELRAAHGLTLAADWFSGDGAAATAGLIQSAPPFTLYAGYGFSNDNRHRDLVTLELGLTFE